MDLFELLKNKLGCDYISDMRYGDVNRQAKYLMKDIDFKSYSTFVLSDMAEYLYKSRQIFNHTEEARIFFVGKGRI